MNTLDLLGWALALGTVTVAASVLIVSLALAVRLWPRRAVGKPPGRGQRERLAGHLRRLFGSRKHPRHPVAPPAPHP